MALSSTLQGRLELRGIASSNDPEFIRLIPWLRTTYVLCGSVMAIGSVFAFTPLLWALVSIAALGAIFPVHPFDLIYNHGLRHLTGTTTLPHSGAPTRFACGIASVWVAAIALFFMFGPAWVGYALGGAIISVVALVSVSHFCIPSAIYQLLLGRPVMIRRALFGARQAASA